MSAKITLLIPTIPMGQGGGYYVQRDYQTGPCCVLSLYSRYMYLIVVHPPDYAGRSRGVLYDTRDVDGAPDVDKHLRLAQDRGLRY